MKATLYITEQCTLCDEAMALALSSNVIKGYVLETVDVAYDDGLFCKYANRVPVLKIAENELNWPFTESEIRAVLQEVK